MTSEVDQPLLELLARAYDEPDWIEKKGRSLLLPRNMSWEVYERTLAQFIHSAVAAAPNDETRLRLRALLANLHLRPALLPDELMRSLGVFEARAAVLRAIHDAFPATPLVGCPLGEAVLDDEKAFREVPVAELALEPGETST